MKCWSCGKTIPDDAQACRYCEAPRTEAVTPEDIAAVEQMLGGMSPDVLAELQQAFEASADGEDFVNRIMVGDCPQCGSAETSDCEDDPEIADICVGRCFSCGQLWCLDCGRIFTKGQSACPQCKP